MTQKTKSGKPSENAQSREDRLKQALKANMAKRKMQAKARNSVKAETDESKG